MEISLLSVSTGCFLSPEHIQPCFWVVACVAYVRRKEVGHRCGLRFSFVHASPASSCGHAEMWAGLARTKCFHLPQGHLHSSSAGGGRLTCRDTGLGLWASGRGHALGARVQKTWRYNWAWGRASQGCRSLTATYDHMTSTSDALLMQPYRPKVAHSASQRIPTPRSPKKGLHDTFTLPSDVRPPLFDGSAFDWARAS